MQDRVWFLSQSHPERQSHNDSGDESSDVRHIRDATRRSIGRCNRTKAADHLHCDPHAKHQDRWNRDDMIKDHGIDLVSWKQDQIGTHHSRNCPGCAQVGDNAVGIEDDLGEGCDETSEQIKEEKTNVPESMFDIIAEYP